MNGSTSLSWKNLKMKIDVGDLVRDRYLGDRFGIVLKIKHKQAIVHLVSGVKLKLELEDLEVVNDGTFI